MRAGGGNPVILYMNQYRSQRHPNTCMKNTPKEAKVLRPFDRSHSSGPTLTLSGSCKEQNESSRTKALKTELALELTRPRTQTLRTCGSHEPNHAHHLLSLKK